MINYRFPSISIEFLSSYWFPLTERLSVFSVVICFCPRAGVVIIIDLFDEFVFVCILWASQAVKKSLELFPFDQEFRFEFPEISSGEWNSISPGLTEKRTTSQGIFKCSKISYLEFPFHVIFPGISRILGWIVRIWKI